MVEMKKQRFGVAVAPIGDPMLLFVDEPTAGLDPPGREQPGPAVREGR